MNSFRKNYHLILMSILLIFIFLSAAICGSTQQTSAIDFFKGKNLDFIVPYSPGGGFDTYARLLAPIIQKHIPGVTVVVRNLPGAGSVIGTNTVYLAKPDGLTIGIINVPGMVFNQVGGSEGVKFDLEKFSWLARVTSESHLLAMSSQGEIKSVEDLKNTTKTLKIALTGVGSDDYFGAIVLFNALGIPMNPIPGYGGQAEASLAVMRGEVDGTQATYSSLRSLLESKELIPILQLKRPGEKDLIEEIPNAVDILEGKDRDLVAAITNIFTLDRSIVGTPDIPEDRLKVLRDAIYNSLNDPEFLAACETAKRPISSLEGSVIEGLIKDTMAQAGEMKTILMDVFQK
jgi:tripartite-type tricarboxylate transporter receptor subunit TctC